MPEKTFTLTVCAAMSSAEASGRSSCCACAATDPKPSKSFSSVVCFAGSLASVDFCALSIICVAPIIAPHLVCPSTRMSFDPRGPTQYSKLPTTLPSACESVLPALRSTKTSPGCWSNRISMGALESAQPRTATNGFWPCVARASRCSDLKLVGEAAVPLTNLWLPSRSFCSARSGGVLPSCCVRTPCMYCVTLRCGRSSSCAGAATV
mmetsp:Transcript_30223/g.76102  ORF Transcript_30223/g.76102 Transcript_30223/m.76102 type:complete len:208 (+) Transcript_30223:557-1180(+)